MMRSTLLAGVLAFLHVSAPSAAPADKTVHVFETGSIRQIAAAQAGKPFVMLVWSLDCTYCAASMQALAAAQKQRPFPVVAIATDNAGDKETQGAMLAKLDAARLPAQSWAFGDAAPEQLRHAIDPAWRGELPRTYFFSADGQRQAVSGVLTPAMIDRLLPTR